MLITPTTTPLTAGAPCFQRIVVRGTNWIGDCVMSLPALKQLRRLFPRAHLAVLVLPWVADIYRHVPGVDELIVFEKEGRHRGSLGLLRLASELTEKNFDLGILFQNAFEGAFLFALARIPARLGYTRDARAWLLTHPVPVPRQFGHQVNYYLHLVSRLGGIQFDPDISLHLSRAIRAEGENLLKESGWKGGPLVGLNPGAYYGPAKRWLLERYAAVADRLIQEQGADVALFGAGEEELIGYRIEERMRRRPLNLINRTSLDQLMGSLACCDILVTNDSGPMHLAAALGVPVIALFGSTDEKATGPVGPRARVIAKDVFCRPCLLRECPIDLRCFASITVEEVYAAAASVLSEVGKARAY